MFGLTELIAEQTAQFRQLQAERDTLRNERDELRRQVVSYTKELSETRQRLFEAESRASLDRDDLRSTKNDVVTLAKEAARLKSNNESLVAALLALGGAVIKT